MEFKISGAESGQKLLKYLLRKTDGTKAFLYKMFRKGAIKVNGKSMSHSCIIKEGDVISLQGLNAATDNRFKEIKADITVLYQDANLIAVDKDGNTAVHAAPGILYDETLLEKVKAYLYRNNEPYQFVVPVHRIDRNTRGIVLFARNFETSKKLSDYFKAGCVTKIYHALLEGSLSKRLFIEANIIRDNNKNIVKVENLILQSIIPEKIFWLKTRYQNSKTISATIIRPIENHDNKTKAEIIIWTGRHHQIRAVCEAFGHPVMGDKKYNNSQYKIGQSLLCKKLIVEDMNLFIGSKQDITV